jgi:hypothetical protein
VAEAVRTMDVRYVCEDCRVKWFVPGTRPIEHAPGECAACGGRLIPLDHEREDRRGVYGDVDAGP